MRRSLLSTKRGLTVAALISSASVLAATTGVAVAEDTPSASSGATDARPKPRETYANGSVLFVNNSRIPGREGNVHTGGAYFEVGEDHEYYLKDFQCPPGVKATLSKPGRNTSTCTLLRQEMDYFDPYSAGSEFHLGLLGIAFNHVTGRRLVKFRLTTPIDQVTRDVTQNKDGSKSVELNSEATEVTGELSLIDFDSPATETNADFTRFLYFPPASR